MSAVMSAGQRVRTETEAQLTQMDHRSREQAAETSRQLAGLSGRLDTITADLSRMSTRLDEVSRRVETLRAQASRAPAPTPSAPAAPAAPATPTAPAPTSPIAVAPAPATPSPSGSSAPSAPSAQTPLTAQGAPGAPRPPAAPVTPAVPAAPAVPGAPPVPPPPRTAVTPAPSPAAPPASSPPAVASPSPGAGVPSAEETYQAASADLSRGRYPLAVQGFREFLRRYPDSPLADDAQYGIGESYFSMARASAGQGQGDRARREWEQAVLEFRKVTANYPRGSKVPTALYKEALALGELKLTAQAQARLQYLIDNFPQSAEAPLARERLAALKP
jgi:tol-pal system protein YbgF